ncbi:MAG: hypothetical protein AMJ79_14965, partial [Phycisphaerae bacterium SM23_30]
SRPAKEPAQAKPSQNRINHILIFHADSEAVPQGACDSFTFSFGPFEDRLFGSNKARRAAGQPFFPNESGLTLAVNPLRYYIYMTQAMQDYFVLFSTVLEIFSSADWFPV